MAASVTFLDSRRTEIAACPELTTFQTAAAAFGAASRGNRLLYWVAAYGDNQVGLSPAYRLRRAIRDFVTAAGAGVLTQADIEATYQSLVNEYAPHTPRPNTRNQDQAALEAALVEDALS